MVDTIMALAAIVSMMTVVGGLWWASKPPDEE